MKHLLLGLTLALLCGSFAFAGSPQNKVCDSRQYKVTALPLRPAGINPSGEVVGTAHSHRAALWSRQHGLTEIALVPGFTSSEGVAVNASGQAIGVAIDLKNNLRQGFAYRSGKVTVLSDGARPRAINGAGVIAGEGRAGEKKITSPMLWQQMTPMDLGGCCGGTVIAINNRGQAIGNIYDEQGHYHAFMWEKDAGLRPIGPDKQFSSALLLNNEGDYVIRTYPTAFLLYRKGEPSSLKLSPKLPSHPQAMNDCSIVVGSYGIFADDYLAFIWSPDAGFRDLNDLIPPDTGWQLQEATAMNDRGEIVGWGTFKGEEDQGFLLTPEP